MNFLKVITPINLASEYEKFKSSSTYHPVFKYEWNKELILDWINKSSKYKYLVNAILNQDLKGLTTEGERYFHAEWNDSLYQTAIKVIENFSQKSIRVPTLQELIDAQQQFLDKLGINYKVEVVDEHGFVARPLHKKAKLQISKYATYYYFSIESSLRHDGVHIIRYLNGKHNRIKRSPNYLPAEEGLASFMQDFGGNEPNNSYFQHAAEYSVTNICRHGSLREAVEYLVEIGFPQDLAWQRAVRHKFGFINTARSGDIMKPAMYFANEQKIKDLSKKRRLKLFLGKISIEELDNYDAYQGRWSSKDLEQIFNKLV